MPRPLRKTPRPPVQPVTLRRIGSREPVEVVAADELARRKEEAELQRYRRALGLDVREEHARLALRLGDTFTVPHYTRDLWWFTRDVNGVDRTVTGATFLFEQPRERTFPFDAVEPLRLWNAAEKNEAALWFDRVQNRLRPPRRQAPLRRAA